MKKLLALMLALAVGKVFAQQQTEGLITYDNVVTMQKIKIEGIDESILAQMPKTRSLKMQLVFSASETLYKAPEVDETNDTNMDNGTGVTMRFSRPKNEIYTNLTSNRKIQLRDFAGKKFLIEDSLRQTPWKLSTDTKEIKGFMCQKATLTRQMGKISQNLVAWYAPDIPVSAGPDGLGGLPGMILELIIDDGMTVTTATEISFRPLKKDEIKLPSGGKKTTEAEFRKMIDEYAKEMGVQGGGSGARIIIRN
jgi:GLPGLI family protein